MARTMRTTANSEMREIKERRLAKYGRYRVSEKGRARNHRYNQTSKRLKAQRERNQVRRERAVHREIVALATRS